MRIVAFLDLDDTLFQTRPKCPDGEPIHAVAFRRDGTPLSFMTQRQRTLLDVWFRSATVIPTTARNRDALARVDLPFNHAAILDFGGAVLLPGGELDEAWDAQVRPRALELHQELQALHREAERINASRHLGVYARVIVDFDMPLYVVIKHLEGDGSKLLPLQAELAPLVGEQFRIHANDNNLSIVPRFLGKEHAVRHIIAHHFGNEPLLTLGMGDSLSDAGFLDVCDYGFMPRGCQLARHRLDPQGSR
jgi:hypothetical protein